MFFSIYDRIVHDLEIHISDLSISISTTNSSSKELDYPLKPRYDCKEEKTTH